MVRVFILFVMVVFNFVAQSAFFPHLAILGVTPDTALVLIVSYAILRGDIEGALFGMLVGFVQDMASGFFLGLFALLGFLTGYVCGKPFKDFFKDNYFLPFAIIIVASLVYQLMTYAASVMFLGQLEFWHYFRTIIVPRTVYTSSLAIPIYSLMHFINVRLERHEAKFHSLFNNSEGDDKK